MIPYGRGVKAYIFGNLISAGGIAVFLPEAGYKEVDVALLGSHFFHASILKDKP
jgi:hypothetical protein